MNGCFPRVGREKAEWIFRSEPLVESIARAKSLTDGPVILLDHAAMRPPAAQDVMAVLKEALDQGLQDIAMFGVCDPEAVAAMQVAGVGVNWSRASGARPTCPRSV
jgi:microcystin degradation protein MlrC